MAISFAKLMQGGLTTIKVDVGLPEPLKVEVIGNKVTGEMVDSMMAMSQGVSLRPVCEQIVPVLKGWSLEDEDARELPITVENLMALPVGVIMGIVQGMTKALNPTK